MAIARLIAPFATLSGTVVAPDAQAANSAVVAMPDANGRTLLRSYVVPTDTNTAAQAEMRSFFSNVSEAYQTLTQAQAEAWQALAQTLILSGRLGLDYRLSWTALFQQVNNYRLQNGQTVTLTPPSLSILPAPGFLDLASDDGDPSQNISITLQTAPSSSTGFFAFRVTRDLGSTSRQARKNELRYPADPSTCILARVSGQSAYDILTTRLNVLQGQRIGVEILVLNADYVPTARTFITNTEVISP